MRALALAALLALARVAGAHSLAPEVVVAELSAPASRVSLGIERAGPDARNARVLVVRVGPRWFALPVALRTSVAAQWRTAWRDAVPQGVVAVLDARTEEPVVRYGRAGAVGVVGR